MVGVWKWSCCYGCQGGDMVVVLRWSGCGKRRVAEVVGYGKSHGGLDDRP